MSFQTVYLCQDLEGKAETCILLSLSAKSQVVSSLLTLTDLFSVLFFTCSYMIVVLGWI